MLDIQLTARHALGISLLAIVVMMWVASSFLMRSIFGEDKTYDKPFLITWINTGTFSLYLIPWTLRSMFKKGRVKDYLTTVRTSLSRGAKDPDNRSEYFRSSQGEYQLMDGSVRSPLIDQSQSLLPPSIGDERRVGAVGATTSRPGLPSANSVRTFGSQDGIPQKDLVPLTTMETAKLGCIFSMLWFAANYFGNISLSYTNVASFTIISSLSGFFTLALGTVLRVETFTIAKLYALVVSIIGVIMVTSQDSSAADSTSFFTDLIIGDILALVGAALYGCYTVFLKYKVRNEERVSMPLFFGFVGIFNIVVLWPVVILLNITGLEPFELPSTTQISLVVAANASITFVSDYLWVLAMLMTSPLVVTVGISMSIPLALLGDHLLYSHTANVWFFIGAGLVFASFIAINLSHDSDQRQKGVDEALGRSSRHTSMDENEADNEE